MRITQEEFDKLPQLDRIKYRQKEDRIKERFSLSYALAFFNVSIKLLIFFFLIGLSGLFICGESLFNHIMQFIWGCGMLIIFIYIFCFFVDVMLSFVTTKKLKELDEEFFKINVKKK